MNVMACIDLHAKACKRWHMRQNIITEIRDFLSETGLSAYRFGFLAVRNGRLVERLEAGNRIWPDTETKVRAFILSERRRRAEIQKKAS